jgi:cytolysin (calcineurin-like family phosphatase)
MNFDKELQVDNLTSLYRADQPSRRQFLETISGVGVAAAGISPIRLLAQEPARDKVSFFVVSDTHYLANREQPDQIDAVSADICGRLVETLNQLPGTEIPAEAGGGRIEIPRGVIHAGDLIDTGDKQGGVTGEMQKTEWAAFVADYGLTGKDGRLRWPIYEVHGNHDSPHGRGLAIEKIIERNQGRPGVSHRSTNGLHYSWDWGHVHFVNLGLIVGGDPAITRKRRYAALDSLEFLLTDLREKVGDSGRPVIITHHVDIARYTNECDLQVPADTKEWDPCDVQAFHRAINGFHVLAIFYGHTHARNVFRWDGRSAKAESGISVFNTDNASHFGGDAQAFFYVEVNDRLAVVREYQTKDRWRSGFFTPQTWQASLQG